MSSRAQRLEHLRSFGLSPYQARLYLNLLEQGEGSAGQLAKRAGIPRGRIYEILRVMESRGLVNVSPEKPTRFSAMPADEMLERHSQQLRKEADEIARDRITIETMFRPERTEANEPPPRFHVVRGRRQVASRFRTLARGAVKSVEMQLSAEAPAEVRQTVANAVTEAFARRVGLRMVSCFDETVPVVLQVLAKKVPGRLRLIHAPQALNLLVADRRSLLLWNARQRGGDPAGEEEIAIMTDDESTVRSFHELFDERWASAGDPGVVIERLRAGAPLEGFKLLRSSGEAFDRYQESLQRARRTVLDFTSAARLAQLAAGSPQVVDKPSGPALRDLVHVSADAIAGLKQFHPRAIIRHLPLDFGLRFTVVDQRECFIFSPLSTGDDARSPYADTLYSDNPEVAKVYQAVFEHLWAQSVPVQERLRELASGEGPPREFVLLRSSEEALAKYREAVRAAEVDVLDLTSAARLGQLATLDSPVFNFPVTVGLYDLVHLTNENAEALRRFSPRAQVRHVPTDFGLRFSVLDSRETFLFPPVTPGDPPEKAYAGTLCSDNPEVAKVYRAVFEHLWTQSVSVEARLFQIQGGEPPEETRVIADREQALATLRSALESSKVEILSMSTGDALLWRIENFPWVGPNLAILRRRVILQATGKEHPVLDRLAGSENLEVRTMEHDIGLRMAVVDGRTVLLVPQGKGSESAFSVEGWKGHGGMIVSNDPAFTEVYARLFRGLWESAG
ncbi:MAG TPA: helix-turn-helix domain-containing protein [Thermoplasmata archaeon]|nr:helix-turn-helix domain-containing protein [Thermoplasmata archaeon]